MEKETKKDQQKTERFNMFISPSESKAVDDWAWQNRVRSKSEAVRRLVQIGLIFDEHANEIAEEFSNLYDMFGEKSAAAVRDLTNSDLDREARISEYVDRTFNLYLETVEQLGSLYHRLNQVFAPAQAIKADEPIKAAQFGMLAAKASAASKLLDYRLEMYEFKKENGFPQPTGDQES